jgi:hypothetical protein
LSSPNNHESRHKEIPYKSFAALLEKLRDQAGPARLMARPDARAIVAVEVFVEGN